MRYRVWICGCVSGLNLHRVYIIEFENGEEVEVWSNEDVLGDKYYVNNELGEGSDTQWFPSVKAIAQNELAKRGF